MAKKWFDGTMASASITVLAGLAVLALAQPAKAGFEWTPPPAKQVPPPVVAAPAPAVDAELLDAPLPVPETVLPVAEPERLPRRVQPSPVMRPAAPPAPVEAANVPPPVMPAPAPGPNFAMAVGFGSDIPLVLAMRQIVPPEFSYSFDPGINPGVRISWSGGKPWDEVLADAVRPLGLEVVVSGNVVWLREGWNSGDEKVRVSAAPMAVPAPLETTPAPLPVPIAAPMSPPPMASAPMEPMPVPLMATEPAPLYAAPAAEPPEPVEQSYPRRQRPEMPEIAEMMAYAQKAPPAPPVAPVFTNDYSGGPVPLMKALPPPPPEPATSMSGAVAPVMETVQPLAMNGATRGPVMDPLEIHFWQAEQGASLKDVLNRWASEANVAILWNSPYDYALPVPMRMHGTFADAVTNLLMGYGMVDPRPLGRLHPNLPAGPSVLVIENYSQATN